MSEQRTFVFSVTFILVFSVIVATIPIGLQGIGSSPAMVSGIDPNLVSGFSDSESFTRDNFTGNNYYYDLNNRAWWCLSDDTYIMLAAKILFGGFLWLGGIEEVKFIDPDGNDEGTKLYLTDITNDAEEGAVRYSLFFDEAGTATGTMVFYYNTTLYADASTAWLANGLFVVHGVGIESTAVLDAGTLLIQLLLLQIPDVPLLLNILLVAPIWACVIYLLWYIIKEMIPFL